MAETFHGVRAKWTRILSFNSLNSIENFIMQNEKDWPVITSTSLPGLSSAWYQQPQWTGTRSKGYDIAALIDLEQLRFDK